MNALYEAIDLHNNADTAAQFNAMRDNAKAAALAVIDWTATAAAADAQIEVNADDLHYIHRYSQAVAANAGRKVREATQNAVDWREVKEAARQAAYEVADWQAIYDDPNPLVAAAWTNIMETAASDALDEALQATQ